MSSAFLYRLIVRLTLDTAAGLIGVLAFSGPNVLYLQSVPMSELPFTAWSEKLLSPAYEDRGSVVLEADRNGVIELECGREDLRLSGYYGWRARGNTGPVVQDLKAMGNLNALFSLAYDRGGKVINMIENRLGTERFFAFLRKIYRDHAWKTWSSGRRSVAASWSSVPGADPGTSHGEPIRTP